jgi:alpha-beta hydrolase superfamily lysophospholipase
VVLVHGAFAKSASWNEVVTMLRSQGYPIVAAANPLRSLPGLGGVAHACLARPRETQ